MWLDSLKKLIPVWSGMFLLLTHFLFHVVLQCRATLKWKEMAQCVTTSSHMSGYTGFKDAMNELVEQVRCCVILDFSVIVTFLAWHAQQGLRTFLTRDILRYIQLLIICWAAYFLVQFCETLIVLKILICFLGFLIFNHLCGLLWTQWLLVYHPPLCHCFKRM